MFDRFMTVPSYGVQSMPHMLQQHHLYHAKTHFASMEVYTMRLRETKDDHRTGSDALKARYHAHFAQDEKCPCGCGQHVAAQFCPAGCKEHGAH